MNTRPDCGVNVHRRCMDEILTTGELCSGNMSHASSSTLSQQESATTSSSVDPIHPGDSVSDDEDVHVTKLQEMDFNNDGGDALYNENGDDLSDGGLDTAATSRYLSATQGANDRVFARNSVSAGSTPDASRRGNTVPSRRTRHLSATSTLSSATTTSYAASVAVSPSGSAAGGSTTADRSLTVVNGKPRRRIFSSQKQRTLSPTNMSDDGLGITGLVTSGGGVPFTPTPPPSAKRLGGVLRDFIQTTAEKSISMDKLKAGPPRLNVFTTLPKNFTRFVMKVGPLAAFQDRIERIIRWDTPSETLFAMSVFMTVCMNPQLLIFVPQLLVIAVIVRNYYAKARRDIGRANGQKLRKSESRTSAGKPVKASQFRPDEIHYRKNMYGRRGREF